VEYSVGLSKWKCLRRRILCGGEFNFSDALK
jgi:hypothetical protein